jgi:hypothetical protein
LITLSAWLKRLAEPRQFWIFDCRFWIVSSSDDTIGSSEHIGWNNQSDLLGGFEIDDKLELRRLLDWQVGRFGSFEDLVNVMGGLAKHIFEVRPIRHETSLLDKLFLKVDTR